jgi:hypothetical protein
MTTTTKRLVRVSVQLREDEPEKTMYFTTQTSQSLRSVMNRYAKRFPDYYTISVDSRSQKGA